MPSPFPGMDPYLERAQVFPDFHGSMITCLRGALQPLLPEPYFAASDERIWVEMTQRYIEPDVDILRPTRAPEPSEEGVGGVAVAAPEPRTRPVLITVPYEEHRETFLDIFATRDGEERLVTAIEILSLSNKNPGPRRRDYLRKQRELIQDGQANLVEIDLLRAGRHTTAVPEALALRQAGTYDYHVCVHRFDRLGDYLVYPIRLDDGLPEVEIPLLPDDGAVTVDFQEVFDRCYDEGPYRRRIRYGEEALVPPLSSQRMEWAHGILAGSQ